VICVDKAIAVSSICFIRWRLYDVWSMYILC